MNQPSDQIRELEGRLAAANERLRRARAAVAQKWDGGERIECDAAHEAVLCLEREIAAAKGEEYAVLMDFPVMWDIGATLPHLMVDEHRALLGFRLSESDPLWDGSDVTTNSSANDSPDPLALVEFEHCRSAKMGSPNDEVLNGHPLYGKGLVLYSAQRVINSRWIAEIQKINSVHPWYRPESWSDLQHFVFWFHDSTFECIARSYTVEVRRESMKQLLVRMVERLISDRPSSVELKQSVPKIVIELASPPDREKLVAQVVIGNEQLAELNQDADQLQVEIYGRQDGQPWLIEYSRLIEVLSEARARLAGSR